MNYTDERVLVLTPTGGDSAVAGELLLAAGIASVACGGIDDLCGRLGEGAGVLLIAEEALAEREDRNALVKCLADQAAWSDVPLVLLTTAEAMGSRGGRELLGQLGAVGNVTLLERPFRVETLVSSIRSALRARHKQYEVRELVTGLRASEERFRQLADAMPQIVWVTRPDGYHEYFNQRWYEYVGGDLNRSKGDNWAHPLHPDDRERARDRWARSLASGEPYEIEYQFRRHDGVYRWFLARGALPVRDAAGHVERWIGTCTDIDDRRKEAEERQRLLAGERSARAAAEAASRMKDEFLATLSHELRTPLNAIVGWSQILAMSHDEQDLTEGLAVIARNAHAQQQIIEDLLDMSRIISGKVRLNVQQVDLVGVLLAAVDTVRHAADTRGVRLQTALDPLDVPVSGDPSRLQQVFWNLLTNAIKFTPRGRVQVRLERTNSHLVVSVVDTGEGIGPEFLPYVFDRFRQADASTTRRHGGLGLGLSIVKQLVELHGGTVRARSPGPGQGSTFTVRLPLTSVQSDAGVEPNERTFPPSRPNPGVLSEAIVKLRGVRVLVVDDEPDVRSLVSRILRDCQVEVATAASAAEAFESLRRDRPDVLVSDIGMPDEDGYTLIRCIRQLPPDEGGRTPALALTAYARAEDHMRAVLAGFQSHAAKPIEPSKLLAMIASLAAGTQTSHAG